MTKCNNCGKDVPYDSQVRVITDGKITGIYHHRCVEKNLDRKLQEIS